jgi:hypothetical protein
MWRNCATEILKNITIYLIAFSVTTICSGSKFVVRNTCTVDNSMDMAIVNIVNADEFKFISGKALSMSENTKLCK